MIRGINRRLPIEITDSLRKRFWARVDKRGDNECWPWTACLRNGYGGMKHKGRVLSAHRLSYVIHFGEPKDGGLVRHTCDNRMCCNPAHLVSGTPQDNVNDMDRIERQLAHGEQVYNAVLSEPLVRAIWEIRRLTGHGKRRIGRTLGINVETVGSVLEGANWKHLMPEWASK